MFISPRKFRIMDDSRDRRLDLDEFIVGCRECRISKMSPQELEEVFRRFDRDNSGKLDYDEFLFAIRVSLLSDLKKKNNNENNV